MSWAEIKKAVNSDLSVPLNEQIDASFDLIEAKNGLVYKTFSFKDGESSSERTVCTITGSGYLYYCALCSSRALNGYWNPKIYIDDVLMVDYSTFPSSVSYGGLGIIHKNYFDTYTSPDYSDRGHILMPFYGSYTGWINRIYSYMRTGTDHQIVFGYNPPTTGASMAVDGLIIDVPIKFNSKIEVKMKQPTITNQDYCGLGIIYSPLS